MQEKDLEETGIAVKGDRVKLKAFCLQNSGRETRMKQLKEIIEIGKSTRVQAKTKPKNASSTSTSRSPKPTLKMEFRHYFEGTGYKLKRATIGWGSEGAKYFSFCIFRRLSESCRKTRFS